MSLRTTVLIIRGLVIVVKFTLGNKQCSLLSLAFLFFF